MAAQGAVDGRDLAWLDPANVPGRVGIATIWAVVEGVVSLVAAVASWSVEHYPWSDLMWIQWVFPWSHLWSPTVMFGWSFPSTAERLGLGLTWFGMGSLLLVLGYFIARRSTLALAVASGVLGAEIVGFVIATGADVFGVLLVPTVIVRAGLIRYLMRTSALLKALAAADEAGGATGTPGALQGRRLWARVGTVACVACALALVAATAGVNVVRLAMTRPFTATVVSVGVNRTCVVTTTGGVKCWGGLGGVEGEAPADVPADLPGFTTGIATVAVGDDYNLNSCALTTAGGVTCWKEDWTSAAPTSREVASSGVAAVTAGEYFQCLLTTTGGVQCWGENKSGQLGNATNLHGGVPAGVSGMASGVVAVSAGQDHACALTSAGGVWCWGSNKAGQLGTASGADSSVPVEVAGLGGGAVSVSAGAGYTCAVTAAGGVMCWGAGYVCDYSLGEKCGVRVEPVYFAKGSTPTHVAGLTSGVAAVSAGHSQACVLTTAGGLKCWGDNVYGLGNATTTQSTTPLDVVGLTSGVAAVSVGGRSACALTVADGVRCWGSNLGDGTDASSRVPVRVAGS